MERWQKPEVEKIAAGGGGDHPSRSSLDYNTPLRSGRGDAAFAHSPFYKLSSELSRESLRIPGAVPFMWEQSPGRRKLFSGAISTTPFSITPQSLRQPQQHLVSKIGSDSAADPEKPSLASLFQQPSVEGPVSSLPAVVASPVLSAIPPPPSADHPRSSSARYSIIQRSTPATAPFISNAALHNGDEDAASDATSDALTATAGGVSVDDSLALSGAMHLASTPSEARNFIMDRFLPAAHRIACDSPQTPSRRFLQPAVAAAITVTTPSCCNGSFRDHAAACAAANRPNSLRYSSVLSAPALSAVQPLRTGSFHSGEEVEEEEEEEEEPTSTPRACGLFPFHIHFSFHSRHSADQRSRRSPSSSRQRNKQELQKKNRKSVSSSGTPTRIIDILNDDHSSSHDDESPVHQLRSKQLEAKRERMKIAAFEHAAVYNSSDPRMKPPFVSESDCRGSPNLHQFLTAQQQAASDQLYNEEVFEDSSYQDAASRFQSPSPAALQLNARAYMHSPFLSTAQSTKSSAGSQEDHPPAAIINDHYIITNQDQWDANPSQSNHLTQHAHIINNALFEYEDQELTAIKGDHCTIRKGDQYYVAKEGVRTGDYCLNHGDYYVINGDPYVIKGHLHKIREDKYGRKEDDYVSNGDHYGVNGGYQGVNGGHQGDVYVSNYVTNGDHYVVNGGHQGDNYVINNSYHVLNKAESPHYIVSNGGNFHGKKMDNISSCPSSLLLSPPLPKSPTDSWLDRAIPLVASSNKSVNTSSSRFSHMHKASPPPSDHPAAPDTMNTSSIYKQAPAAGSFVDSKWEALVKGSQILQPGHLRFSKELLHQSETTITKVGAS